jgi:hypothetical protein
VLANPFKTRLIAEAQIKTDKVDARIIADLLRGKLVPNVHIVGRESRQIKEVLRQRCSEWGLRAPITPRLGAKRPGRYHALVKSKPTKEK